MARTHSHLNLSSHLKPISDLPDYKIESGDPDPRGWTVTTRDGESVGRVEDLVVDTTAMKVRHLIVTPTAGGASTGKSVLLNTSEIDLRNDRCEVVARAFPGGASAADYSSGAGAADYAGHAGSRGSDHERTITRSEEELEIGKREVSRGEAKISKHVETEHVSQPVTRRREEVVVERRPVEAGARADASIGNDEIRIPLTEEELVVEKRPVVKEELVIGKRVVEERDTVEADLRREEFDIDNPTTDGTNRGTRRDGR